MTRTRREFSKDTKRAAFARSARICECHLMPWIFKTPCKRPLTHGNTFYEHIDPDGAGGRNDLSNCAALTKTCWRFKTDTVDRPLVAKVIRQTDFQNGTFTPTFKPLPCGRNSPFKKRIGYFRPVWRDSGRPV